MLDSDVTGIPESIAGEIGKRAPRPVRNVYAPMLLEHFFVSAVVTAVLVPVLPDDPKHVWLHRTPFVMIVVTAALASLPGEPFRAAQIDGASRWQIFRYLTLPMLTPVLLVTALLRFMDAIKVFDTIYVLTGGGPGYATEMLSSYIYKQGLRYFNIGGAAAASWMFLLVILAISMVMIRLRARAGRTE